MATRGIIGYVKENEEFGFYNHYDSYPTGLLRSVLKKVQENPDILSLEDVNPLSFRKAFGEVADEYKWNVGSNKGNEIDFIYDSLMCEYAYLFNYDTKKLECYKGFNKDKDEAGRYANVDNSNDEYKGSRLLLEIPFKEIPNLNPDRFTFVLDELSDFTSLKKDAKKLSDKQLEKLSEYFSASMSQFQYLLETDKFKNLKDIPEMLFNLAKGRNAFYTRLSFDKIVELDFKKRYDTYSNETYSVLIPKIKNKIYLDYEGYKKIYNDFDKEVEKLHKNEKNTIKINLHKNSHKNKNDDLTP